MAMTTEDALLCAPGSAGVAFEEARAMVAFHRDDIAAAQVLMHVSGDVAEIGEPGEGATREKQIALRSVGENETDRLLRIVRDGETRDLQVAAAEGRAGFKKPPRRFAAIFLLNSAGGGGIGKNFGARVFFKTLNARRMIPVLVGEKHGVDFVRAVAGGTHELGQLAPRKAGVDEHQGVGGFEKGGISGAAAAEDLKSHGHDRDGGRSGTGGCRQTKKTTITQGALTREGFDPAMNHSHGKIRRKIFYP
jgi:hypothetical protein